MFVLSFKLISGRLQSVKYSSPLETELLKALQAEKDFFTKRRAVPSIRKELRNDILSGIKRIIENEVKKEMKKSL